MLADDDDDDDAAVDVVVDLIAIDVPDVINVWFCCCCWCNNVIGFVVASTLSVDTWLLLLPEDLLPAQKKKRKNKINWRHITLKNKNLLFNGDNNIFSLLFLNTRKAPPIAERAPNVDVDDDDVDTFCCSSEHPLFTPVDDDDDDDDAKVDDADVETEFNVCVVPICCCCGLLLLLLAAFCCCCSFNVVVVDLVRPITDVVVFDDVVDEDDADDDDDETERPLKQRDNSAAARFENDDTSADILPIVDNNDKQRLQLPILLFWLRLMARNAANKQAVVDCFFDDRDDCVVDAFFWCGCWFFSCFTVLSLYDDNNNASDVSIFSLSTSIVILFSKKTFDSILFVSLFSSS